MLRVAVGCMRVAEKVTVGIAGCEERATIEAQLVPNPGRYVSGSAVMT
jgi:hypothetical protein